MIRLLAIVLAVILVGGTATAPARAVTPLQLGNVDVAPPSEAGLPASLVLYGENGAPRPLRFWLDDKPTVWLLADYTCATLCGPMISIVSDALASSGLHPSVDFRLVVVGLDPKDTAADAATMKRARIGSDAVLSATDFVRGDAATIGTLARALGFRSIYDAEHDQYAHPAAAFVITPSGGLASALSGLAVDPTTIRLALIAAGEGKTGGWTDHLRLLCYGYDPASGTYTLAIGRLLAAAAAVTVAVLVLLIGILFRHERLARGMRAPNSFAPPSRTSTTN
ncbi:SCO family protein [Bradyrhizobium cytisi]|uniref:SCO family protein n=1 Tax=Bradyrhizobium cytisi TaxID=515489 RepID=A0A5S4WMM6_9BRAD|nr:SCO family protein [Bradyrhizobium cytisi]TYL83341.1 SCO family protein [Bradyrhizobium cytisi]